MKKVTRYVVLSTLVVLFLASVAGAAEPEAMDYAQRYVIDSEVMGEERTVIVSTPAGYDNGDMHYPVLYLTDGGAHILHTAGTVEFLARNGRIPELIVVGVTNTDRTRDLTPTSSTINRPDGTVMEFPTSGGADKFLDFFATELIPFVESKYRTQPYRVFSGHSFGGLFAAYTFVSRPDLFNAYIAASPSMNWDEQLILKKAKQLFSSRKELKVNFFITLGDEPRMQDAFDAFEAFLGTTEMPGFNWGSRQFNDEDHGSVVLRSHYFGLRNVFDEWLIPRDPDTGTIVGGFEAMLEHYRMLSAKYEYEVLPPEAQVNGLGYQSLLAGDPETAIKVFRYNVASYPGSSNPHDSLGEALEGQGQLNEALANYSKAAKLAERNGDANLALFQQNAKRVEDMIKTGAKIES